LLKIRPSSVTTYLSNIIIKKTDYFVYIVAISFGIKSKT